VIGLRLRSFASETTSTAWKNERRGVSVIDAIVAGAPEAEKKALLVVDDEEGIRELLTMLLESAGYRCLPAPNGAEALELFRDRHHDIDGIVTDVNMPVLDGYGLVRAAREIAPEVKIVLSSGSLGEAERRIAADLHVTAFLPKPYTSPQLMSCIRSVFPSNS
jgi:two-component system, cell cycle sensor histidine kinase and response regulator CckA